MMSKTMQYARDELDKYLDILGVQAEISLGLFEDFGVELQVKDSVFDDAIAISVKDKAGYVAGINERSVLLAVYRLLKEWGIYWVRPGKNGTYFPKECTAKDVEILEKASKRHRIMCIEGAVSLENVLDMIEWLPKAGYNGYYIQFANPFEFFDRWYSHRKNPFREADEITPEITAEYRKIMVQEIKKRGLMLYAMGHGWTCIPFGIPDNGWYALKPEEIPESYKNICAMINGKRKVWNDTPLQGQLCYSDPFVRSSIVNCIVDYVKNNPEADVVVFWLGDYFNNTCECPECTKLHFSDYAVRMLNDVTNILVKEGLKTKIAFSIGYNKMQPPKEEKILNQENLLLDFAPITRDFGVPMPNEFKIKGVPEYKVNGYQWDPSIDKLLGGLYAWKQHYKGDVVDFDYHLMWDHVFDAGGEGIAKVIHQDIKNFGDLGMNGYISCQLQRNAFPTSIAMTTMANTLWNTSTDFEQMKRELYAASFGSDMVEELCAYFECLSDAFRISEIRGFTQIDKDEYLPRMKRAIKVMEDFAPVVEAHLNVENECHRESWNMLKVQIELYTILGEAAMANAVGDKETFVSLKEKAIMTAWEKEEIVQPVFDSYIFEERVRNKMADTRFVPV